MTEELKGILNNIDWDKLRKDREDYQKQKFNFKKTIYVSNVQVEFGIYAIYRLSNQSNTKVKLLHCGKAYTNAGEHTTQYEKCLSKYNIEYEFTASTKDSFYRRLFFASKQYSRKSELETPNTVYTMLKDYVDRWCEKEREKE